MPRDIRFSLGTPELPTAGASTFQVGRAPFTSHKPLADILPPVTLRPPGWGQTSDSPPGARGFRAGLPRFLGIVQGMGAIRPPSNDNKPRLILGIDEFGRIALDNLRSGVARMRFRLLLAGL